MEYAATKEGIMEAQKKSHMEAVIKSVTAVLPAADVTTSVAWWVEKCGFTEAFRFGEYAGIERGGASLHISGMSDKELARKVGDQTMVRVQVENVDAMWEEYLRRGGAPHPNAVGVLEKPWGSREFGAIDPNGVCVTFAEANQ